VVASDELRRALAAAGVGFSEGERLALHTTIGIGGEAPIFLKPTNATEVLAALAILTRFEVPFRILGAGSNLLVDDGPLDFAVVALKPWLEEPAWAADGVVAAAGAFLPGLARAAAERGLGGLEFAIGIPGSVGGALRMNAGAAGSAMETVVEWAEVARVGEREVAVERLRPHFRYRSAGLADQDVVLRVRFRLTRGEPTALLAIQAENIARRRQTQPTAARSAGCMFKNPAGDSAGRLVDACGLKGLRRGAAEVSTLHANYVLNRGGASAAEVRALIAEVKARVRAATGVELEEEVVRWPTRP